MARFSVLEVGKRYAYLQDCFIIFVKSMFTRGRLLLIGSTIASTQQEDGSASSDGVRLRRRSQDALTIYNISAVGTLMNGGTKNQTNKNSHTFMNS